MYQLKQNVWQKDFGPVKSDRHVKYIQCRQVNKETGEVLLIDTLIETGVSWHLQ